MSDLRFGLIGASYVAASRMVPAFRANGIVPKALFDSEARRFQYWRDNDLDLLTTDLDELLSSDIDAVYISSRNDQHAAHAIAAAQARKHVLVEKPMALTLADARAIIVAADQSGVWLAVNHHLPGSPPTGRRWPDWHLVLGANQPRRALARALTEMEARRRPWRRRRLGHHCSRRIRSEPALRD
jgi:predicted dehydrogenase